jgi:hypothetical protein
MNLAAYDKLNSNIDINKTWIDASKKVILSREINYRKYVTFGKRYDTNENKTIFFIILLDDPPLDRPYSNVIVDGYGRIRIYLKNVWKELGLEDLHINIGIIVKHTQNADDGDIYELRCI